MFNKDFSEFVSLLNAHGVEYLVVGGYALAAHGHPRFTGDLDIWLQQSKANASRVLDALRAFGFGSLDISVSDLLKPDGVVQLGYPPGRIDLLTSIDGVSFDLCSTRKEMVLIQGLPIPFIGLEDFKTNKKATGRLKDLADLESLNQRTGDKS